MHAVSRRGNPKSVLLNTENLIMPKASKLVNKENRFLIKQFLVAEMIRFLIVLDWEKSMKIGI